MKKRGFTILEIMVALMISTILLLMALWAYKQYVDVRNTIGYETQFNNLAERVSFILKDNSRITAEVLTPRYVSMLDPDIGSLHSLANSDLGESSMLGDPSVLWINTEKMFNSDLTNVSTDYFNSIYNMTIIDPRNPSKMANQLAFLGLSGSDVAFSGNTIPLLFIQGRYGLTSQGIKYPYKIFNLIIMSPDMFKKLKMFIAVNGVNGANAASIDNIKKLFGYIFNITDNGIHVNYGLNINDTDSDFVSIMTNFLGNNYKAEWNRMKYSILVKTIDNSQDIKNIVENTYNKMYSIKKNVEDWAVIQARIAAYDSTNGDNMDKDYFITLGDDTEDKFDNTETLTVDKTRTLLPDNTATEITDTDDSTKIDERSLNNGFFICTQPEANSNGLDQIDKFYCHGKQLAYIGKEICNGHSGVEIKNASNSDIVTEFLVNIAYPNGANEDNINSVANTDLGCTLSLAARKLLASTRFTQNVFGIPVRFSNAGGFVINFQNSYLSKTDQNSAGIYKESNSIPIIERDSNPPYTAKLVTFFPWILGGVEPDGESDIEPDNYIYPVENSDGIGVLSMPIFAHVF
ncbi:MAG: type II secretion system protein [Chlorobi bacterium]|nr:type II secretion system protein [Chlorobiota bacterium]